MSAVLLSFCLLSWLVSTVFFIKGFYKHQQLKNSWLFLMVFSFGISLSLLNPFLHSWDEQFHALIAKNGNLVPTLFKNELLNLPYNWVHSEVWLHKQPLFTWLAIPFVKLFGTTATAYRFIYCVLFAGTVVFISEIGKKLIDAKIAFYAALIASCSGFLWMLLIGVEPTDQNDISFLFFVTASFWALLKWNEDHRIVSSLLVGIFAGAAILTKWLVGGLAFGPFLILVIYKLIHGEIGKKEIVSFLGSAIVMTVIALSWQLFASYHFPELYALEMKYNTLHFFEVLENHNGDFFFHFNEAVQKIYFAPILFWTFFSLGVISVHKKLSQANQIIVFLPIVLVYAFFTMAKTKMPGFTLPVYSFMIVIVAAGVSWMIDILSTIKLQLLGKFAFVILLLLNIDVYNFASKNAIFYPKENLYSYKQQQSFVNWMKSQSQEKDRVIFNVNFQEFGNISWMYFTNDIAYPQEITKITYEKVIAQKMKPYQLQWNASENCYELNHITNDFFESTTE